MQLPLRVTSRVHVRTPHGDPHSGIRISGAPLCAGQWDFIPVEARAGASYLRSFTCSDVVLSLSLSLTHSTPRPMFLAEYASIVLANVPVLKRV